MTKIIILLLVSLSISANAQKRTEKKSYPLNWHMLSHQTDSVYGAEVDRAYEFLENRSPKRRTIVAILDSSCDTEHEDLKEGLWINKKEIVGNGIDDDKNGYIDDIHGWNFLGNVKKMSLEADREFLRLHKKYENIDTLKLSKKDYVEYNFYMKELHKLSPLCMAYTAIGMANMIFNYAETFDRELKERFPNEEIGRDHFLKLMKKDEKNNDRINAHFYFILGWSKDKSKKWEQIYGLRHELVKGAKNNYDKAIAKYVDQRGECGDDINNIKDTKYGSNILTVGKSNHSTHIAGIVGAKRGNHIGIEGIADVELMILRINSESGDEYDKDVALAIRYAVDNGANIINMSFGKTMSTNKEWVDDAMMYADKKGVLMIHASGNSGNNIEENRVYPTKFINKKKVVNNFICVGSSSASGAPAGSSNYSNNYVDLFAPGVEIYSTVGGNKYNKMNGTSMAAPVVTGVAALIWNYFPELKAQEVKQVILDGVTNMGHMTFSQPQSSKVTTKPVDTYYLGLCKTGGIVNAYESVKKACEITK